MSSSAPSLPGLFPKSVSPFQYPPTPPALPELASMPEQLNLVHIAEDVLKSRLAQAHKEGAAEAEARLRREYEERVKNEAAKIEAAIQRFEKTSKHYYERVEAEVVSLSLSIAAKILHRESQIDPQIMLALVQMSLKQMKEGSSVKIRVRPEEARRWREHFASAAMKITVIVVEDPMLQPKDCLLETELGTANMGLEVQLKEVERGFFDVLAQKPQV